MFKRALSQSEGNRKMTDRKFKVGDIVVCIDPTTYIDVINVEANVRYEIREINEPYMYLEDNPHPWFMHRFRLSDEQHEPKCVMTQDQFAALKASLETLKDQFAGNWEKRNRPGQVLNEFFRDMEAQGLLSDPKPKTAKEIARETLSSLTPYPAWASSPPGSNFDKIETALKTIANLPD